MATRKKMHPEVEAAPPLRGAPPAPGETPTLVIMNEAGPVSQVRGLR